MQNMHQIEVGMSSTISLRYLLSYCL